MAKGIFLTCTPGYPILFYNTVVLYTFIEKTGTQAIGNQARQAPCRKQTSKRQMFARSREYYRELL